MKLQDAIGKITPQLLLRRLMLFDLINIKEKEMVQHSIAQQRGKQIDKTISLFLVIKLLNESSVYHQRFKYFLGYYEDLRSMYLAWNSLCKSNCFS